MSWLWSMVHNFDDFVFFVCIVVLPIVLLILIALGGYEYYIRKQRKHTNYETNTSRLWVYQTHAHKGKVVKQPPITQQIKNSLPSVNMSRDTETILNRIVGWFFNQL